MADTDTEQDLQLQQLINEELIHLRNNSNSNDTLQQENFGSANVYFDKQLTQLVIAEEFDFTNISKILTEVFANDKLDTSQQACRERWAHLYKNRNRITELKEKEKEDKRAKSVAAFKNPYSLYSVEELIQNLQRAEKNRSETFDNPSEFVAKSGYNILKDNFRKITNLEQYHQRQAKMKEALEKAKQEVYEEKPLFFTPHYERIQYFQVKGEELTAQKAKQILAYQIEMEKIGRELTRQKQQDEQKKYEQIIRKRVQKQQKMQRSNQKGDIQQNWDQYESDSD